MCLLFRSADSRLSGHNVGLLVRGDLYVSFAALLKTAIEEVGIGIANIAFFAGIMVYISLDELLPLAHRYGQEHLVIIGIGAGMGIMAFSLVLLA